MYACPVGPIFGESSKIPTTNLGGKKGLLDYYERLLYNTIVVLKIAMRILCLFPGTWQITRPLVTRSRITTVVASSTISALIIVLETVFQNYTHASISYKHYIINKIYSRDLFSWWMDCKWLWHNIKF